MKQIFVSLILLISFSSIGFSQKKTDKERSEELQFLRYESILNLKFDYEGMLVGKTPEEVYLEETRDSKNSRIDGSGDKWLEAWEFNKSDDFPRRFTVLFNKYLEKKDLSVSQGARAPYTLTVKTVMIDPGFYTGTVINSPAFADLYFIFTKTNEPDKVLCKLRIKNVDGSASFMSFDAGLRMQECYAKAGKLIAKYILDYAYKR